MNFFLSNISLDTIERENKTEELISKGFKIEIEKNSVLNHKEGYIEIKNLNNLLLFYRIIGAYIDVKLQYAYNYGFKTKCKYELYIIKPETHIPTGE